MIRFFDPGKSYLNIKGEILCEINRVLSAGDLILRDDVEKFEENLRNFVGTKYAIALNSGTDALYLALRAMGIGEKHKVLVPSYTFVATAQVVNQLGATAVFYDLDDRLEDIDPEMFDVLMVAHISGELAYPDLRDCPMIEDACQALGAIQNPKSFAQAWSFYPAKILGAYGDAGALTTNSEELYREVRELRNHYKTDYAKYGINSRMDNLQAAILNVKFKYLPEVLARRKEIAELYLAGLQRVGLPNNNEIRVWQDFIIRTSKRNELYEYLKEHGIETMKNEYPMPVEKLPVAARYEAETLRLPLNEVVTDSEVREVIEHVNEFSKR